MSVGNTKLMQSNKPSYDKFNNQINSFEIYICFPHLIVAYTETDKRLTYYYIQSVGYTELMKSIKPHYDKSNKPNKHFET